MRDGGLPCFALVDVLAALPAEKSRAVATCLDISDDELVVTRANLCVWLATSVGVRYVHPKAVRGADGQWRVAKSIVDPATLCGLRPGPVYSADTEVLRAVQMFAVQIHGLLRASDVERIALYWDRHTPAGVDRAAHVLAWGSRNVLPELAMELAAAGVSPEFAADDEHSFDGNSLTYAMAVEMGHVSVADVVEAAGLGEAA